VLKRDVKHQLTRLQTDECCWPLDSRTYIAVVSVAWRVGCVPAAGADADAPCRPDRQCFLVDSGASGNRDWPNARAGRPDSSRGVQVRARHDDPFLCRLRRRVHAASG